MGICDGRFCNDETCRHHGAMPIRISELENSKEYLEAKIGSALLELEKGKTNAARSILAGALRKSLGGE